ncbi:histone lysine acetyltransferase CREBBP-like [Hyalella azteca]|uniref:histone acetyltransferase n=1 Tax=Hyalella azteca TaxID=294128 RepID=A0A8B7NRM7_HYAAZ|nr:histone lysine acetyltransferase CREBBP-like [Hyalella azteca]
MSLGQLVEQTHKILQQLKQIQEQLEQIQQLDVHTNANTGGMSPVMEGGGGPMVPTISAVPNRPDGVQGGPAAPGVVAQPRAAADPEKRKLIQQQLVLLLHADKCQRKEQSNGDIRQCNLPHCQTMKNVLSHMTMCQAGKTCLVPHCASSRQIISHWKNCARLECPICEPVKTTDKNKQNPNNNNNMAANAAAAPGMTGRRQQQQQQQKQIGPQLIHSLSPGHRQTLPAGHQLNLMSPNATSNMVVGAPKLPNVSSSMGAMTPSMAESWLNLPNHPGQLPGSMVVTARHSEGTKEWHHSITSELRNHIVQRIVQAILPRPDPITLQDRRMQNLVNYARKVEGDMFNVASSRPEYYHLVAEKIYKIEKELHEKRMQRRQFPREGQPAIDGSTAPPPQSMIGPVNAVAVGTHSRGPFPVSSGLSPFGHSAISQQQQQQCVRPMGSIMVKSMNACGAPGSHSFSVYIPPCSLMGPSCTSSFHGGGSTMAPSVNNSLRPQLAPPPYTSTAMNVPNIPISAPIKVAACSGGDISNTSLSHISQAPNIAASSSPAVIDSSNLSLQSSSPCTSTMTSSSSVPAATSGSATLPDDKTEVMNFIKQEPMDMDVKKEPSSPESADVKVKMEIKTEVKDEQTSPESDFYSKNVDGL